MKKIYSLPGLVLSVAFLIGSFILIDKSIEASHEFKLEKNKISEILNFNDRLLSLRDWVFSESAWQERKVKYDSVLQKSEEHYQQAVSYGNYMLFAALGFFALMLVLYAKKRIYFGITLSLSVIAIVMLVQGIMNPVLEMGAFEEDMTFQMYVKPKDIPYYSEAIEKIEEWGGLADHIEIIPFFGESLASAAGSGVDEITDYMKENADEPFGTEVVFKGRTYFYYQNKGIMDVISLLWNNNNKPVAMAIGTFSVIVPLIKLLFTLFILLFPVTNAKRLRKFLSFIAKWSMADVFVVALFLAYLSFANMSPGVQMESNVLYGMYFFGGYVLISIVLGIMLNHSIKEKVRIKEEEEVLAVEPVLSNDLSDGELLDQGE